MRKCLYFSDSAHIIERYKFRGYSMKIRKNYAIYDQLKLFLVILALLLFVVALFVYTFSHNTRRKSSTMEHLLHTALEPVGTTMYIWGGGWDAEDNEAGATSTRIGLSPTWKEYASRQDASYDFTKHRWERENGLDCSGYVGWVLYNTFETKDGELGYVMSSTDMALTYARWRFGKAIKNPKEFLPGDIVSMDGHVWISLGTCADGSVLFVHSSPPGVMVCGTEGVANQLAEAFMSEYYPDWYERYPNCSKPDSYLENVTLMRWNENTLKGAKDFQKLSGEEVLDYLKTRQNVIQ